MNNPPSVNELKETIKEIKEIITELDRNQIFDQNKREEYFFTNHSKIMSMYPFLVSQLCSDTSNNMLNEMLKTIHDMEVGKKTPDQADISIGEKLGESFLKSIPKQ